MNLKHLPNIIFFPIKVPIIFFIIKVALGQFSQLGPIAVWQISPLFTGKYLMYL